MSLQHDKEVKVHTYSLREQLTQFMAQYHKDNAPFFLERVLGSLRGRFTLDLVHGLGSGSGARIHNLSDTRETAR